MVLDPLKHNNFIVRTFIYFTPHQKLKKIFLVEYFKLNSNNVKYWIYGENILVMECRYHRNIGLHRIYLQLNPSTAEILDLHWKNCNEITKYFFLILMQI